MRKLQIGVIGSGGSEEYPSQKGPNQKILKQARIIGLLLARRGAVVVTGGKGGIMEQAAIGAKETGGVTVGIVKGSKRFVSYEMNDIEVVTGMEADGLDELLLVMMSDALIAIGGGAGTLQEIALAYRNKKPVVALVSSGQWSKVLARKYLDGRKTIRIYSAKTPELAVRKALILAKNYAFT